MLGTTFKVPEVVVSLSLKNDCWRHLHGSKFWRKLSNKGYFSSTVSITCIALFNSASVDDVTMIPERV
jgi:hypothetical protein